MMDIRHGSSMRLMFLRPTIWFVSLGTLRFTSPWRCLIWSIAIIIEELLTGINVFLGEYANPMITSNQNHLWQQYKREVIVGDNSKISCSSYKTQTLSFKPPHNLIFWTHLCMAVGVWWVVCKFQFVSFPISIKNKLVKKQKQKADSSSTINSLKSKCVI